MSLNTPRLRTPGRGIAASPHGAGAKAANQTQLVPTQPPPIPKYTQEELDNDIVNPSMWTYIYERVIVFLSFTAMIIYMTWRWRCFLTRPSTLWISLPLIVSETLLVFPGLFISYFMILHRIHRPMKRLADMKFTPSQLPTVDVFIPCLNEPAEVRGHYPTCPVESIHVRYRNKLSRGGCGVLCLGHFYQRGIGAQRFGMFFEK